MAILDQSSSDGFVSSFAIAEQTGEKRSLVLSGRALPYKPFTLDGEQRAEVTWYPGSPVGSLQVLGASEKPTTINGAWKDRFIMRGGYGITAPGLSTAFEPDDGQPPAMLDGRPIANVKALVDVVDDFRRKGMLVRVTWLDITRAGIISGFRQKWMTANDVEWELEFTWVAQAEDAEAAQVLVASADASSFANNAETSLGGTIASAAAASAALANDTQTVIATSLDKVQASVERVQSTIDSAVAGVTAPIDAARGIAAMAVSIATEYDAIMASVTERVLVTSDLAAYLTRMNACLGARRTARVARDEASNAQRALLSQIDPALLGVVTARDEEDLRAVATAFYGTPDGWKTIRDYNHLLSSKLSAGQVVLVPQRQAA